MQIKGCCLLLFMVVCFIGISLYAEEWRILTNTNIAIYIEPGGKIQKYRFYEKELLAIIQQTNINNEEWLFVIFPRNIKGWIESKYTETFTNYPNFGKDYLEIFQKELGLKVTENYYKGSERVYNLKFFDFSGNGYIGMKFISHSLDSYENYRVAVLYSLEKEGIKRVVFDNSNLDKVIFKDIYILLIEKEKITVFNKEKFEKDYNFKINPTKILYKGIGGYVLGGTNTVSDDSYFDIDENTLEVTASQSGLIL